MKRLSYLLFVLLLAFIAGCSADENTTDPNVVYDNFDFPIFTVSTISVDPQFEFVFYCSMDIYLFSYEVFDPSQHSYGVTDLDNYKLLVGQAYTDEIKYPKLNGTWRIHFKGKELTDQQSFDVWASVNLSAKK
ncbi:MAG: hypothetical protein V1720_13940 [bacterium]